MLPYFVKKVGNKEFYNVPTVIYLENVQPSVMYTNSCNRVECVGSVFGRTPGVCVVKHTLPG